MRKHRKIKYVLVVLSLVLILSCALGGVLAYLNAGTDTKENEFVAGSVSCTVNNDNTVTNDSNIPVYIRVRVVANLLDNDGNYRYTSPAISVTGTGWTKNGDYLYYGDPVAIGGKTPALTVSLAENAAQGYTLNYEILAEAIQAEGMGADSAQDAWVEAKKVVQG